MIGRSTASRTPIWLPSRSKLVAPPRTVRTPDSSSRSAIACVYPFNRLSIGPSISPSITLIQSTAPPQHVIGDKRESLTQRQEQRLRSRHVQRTGVAREELAFQNTRLLRAHRFAKRFRDSSLQTSVIVDG